MPHSELHEYEYDDHSSERFDYNLRTVLDLLETSRLNIAISLGRVLAEPSDAVYNLCFAAGEATYAVGLLTPEVEFTLGSKFVAQFRALADSSRVLWEIMNRRHLFDLRHSKNPTPITKMTSKTLAQRRRQNEERLAVAAVRESFSLLLSNADREALRPAEVDDLDKLLLAASLNDPADDLCALLEKADFSTSPSMRAPVLPPPLAPKKQSAWQQLAGTVTLYKNEWVIAPPPDILLPGEQAPGNFCYWDTSSPQHYSQTRRRPKREAPSVEESHHFNPYSRKGRKSKSARRSALEKQLLFDTNLAGICGGDLPYIAV